MKTDNIVATSHKDSGQSISEKEGLQDTVFFKFDTHLRLAGCSGPFLGHSIEEIRQNPNRIFAPASKNSDWTSFLTTAVNRGHAKSRFEFIDSAGTPTPGFVHASQMSGEDESEVQVFISCSPPAPASSFSHERFSRLIEEVNCYFWEVNLQEIFTYVSSSVEHMLGFKNYELTGSSIKMVNSRKEYEAFSSFYDDLKLNPRKIRGVKKRTQRKDGSEISVMLSAEPVYSVDGTLVAYRGVTRDLSAEYSNQEQYEIFQERYDAIIRDSRMWFWEVDSQLRITYLSPNFTEVTGVDIKAVLGKTCAEVYEQTTDFQVLLDNAVGDRASFQRESIRLRLPDGRLLHLSSTGSPFFHDNGSFAGYRGHNRCISKEIESARKLAESEQRFKNIVESSNTWFWEVDTELRLTYLSSNFVDITGFELNDHLGKGVFNIRSEEESARLIPLTEAIKKHQKSFKNFVGTILHKDGRTLHIESNGTPFYEDGELKGWRGSNRNISNEVQYRQALEESEMRFKQIVESSNTYFWEVDQELKFVYLSGNFEELTGYSTEEALGKEVFFLHPVDVQEQIRKHHPQNLESPSPLTDVAKVILKKDGTEIQTLSSSIPVYEDDVLVGFRGHERDVTSENRYRREIEESEARNQAIISTIPDQIFLFSRNGKYIDCAGEGYKTLYIPSDFLGKSIEELWPKSYSDRFMAAIEKAANTGESVQIFYDLEEFEIPGKFEARFVRYNADHDVLCLVRNITADQKLKDQLKDALDQTEAIVSSLPDMVFVINKAGDIIACKSPDPTEITNIDDFVGKNVRDLYAPGRASYFLRVIQDALKADSVHVVEYRIRNAQGNKNHYEARVTRIADRDDQVIAVIRNVTASKFAAQQLAYTLDKLKRSNEELEQFAYVASHDLQEPIRLVASYVKLLKQSETTGFSSKDLQYLDFMEASCARMKRLVVDLLDFSKLESKVLKIDRIDTMTLFNPILLTFDRQIREKNAEIEIGRMPQVMCDPVLISQVFANLISNALKFTLPDQSPEISISAQLAENQVEFRVQDNGVGIPEEDFERIFSIFHRGRQTADIPGSGIGMAVCRKIVERHGGKIWISSPEEGGTIVHFTIPEIGHSN